MWDGNADAWNDFPHFFAGFFSCEGGVAYHAHNYIQGQSRTRGAVYHEKVQFCSMNTFGREWNRLREITKLCIRQAYLHKYLGAVSETNKRRLRNKFTHLAQVFDAWL